MHYQADSMCGQWWARACGLPSISEDACVRSSLQKIFDFNVKKFKCGQIGPINGMRPDGKPDTSCMQSVEVILLYQNHCKISLLFTNTSRKN